MADNYLENKMDEYRRGMLSAVPRRKTTPSGHAGGCASFLPFPPGLRVLMLCEVARPEIVKALVDAGCRVAFTGVDRVTGAGIARSCGAQHHPISPDDREDVKKSLELLRHNWRGDIHAIISYGYSIPAVDAFKIIVGEDGTIPCDLHLPSDSEAETLLWALLPQTRSYFSANRRNSR